MLRGVASRMFALRTSGPFSEVSGPEVVIKVTTALRDSGMSIAARDSHDARVSAIAPPVDPLTSNVER